MLALATLLFCWKLVFGGLVVIGYDTMTYMFPYRHFAAAALGEGRIPLWNPYIYYGAPFLANLQSAVFYPLHLIFLLRPATEAMNWSVVVHLFLAALFASLLARYLLGQDALAATVSGALYGLGGFVGSQVGHLNQLNAAAWLPAALLVEHLALSRRRFALGRPPGPPDGRAAPGRPRPGDLHDGGAARPLRGLLRPLAAAAPGRRWLLAPRSRPAPGCPPRRSRASLTRLATEGSWAAITLGVAGALAGGMAALQLLPTNELTALSIRAGGMSIGEASSFSLPPASSSSASSPPSAWPAPPATSTWAGSGSAGSPWPCWGSSSAPGARRCSSSPCWPWSASSWPWGITPPSSSTPSRSRG